MLIPHPAVKKPSVSSQKFISRSTYLYPVNLLRPTLLLLILVARLCAQPTDRPNVLFIAVDDLRTNLGCYGDTLAVTPQLDALAARGTLFARAFCQIAVCNPSRASMMTGRRPDDIGVVDLATHFRKKVPDAVTLPQLFKLHGYHSEAIGKIYHDPASARDEPSWSVPAQLDDTRAVRGKYATEENLRIYQPDGRMGQEKAAATEEADVADDAYIDGRVAQLAVERLSGLASRRQPFFLAVGFRRPHLPFSAPKQYWDLYDPVKLATVLQPEPPERAPDLALHGSVELRGYTDLPADGALSDAQVARLRHGYYAATSYVDAQIGRVLEALRSQGLEENTIVVVWSDHGFHLGEHGLWAKTTNYEADTRVPLLIAAPGKATAARTEALVELIDVYPTLAQLCGLPVPPEVTGQSLVANLADPALPGCDGALSQFGRPWGAGRASFVHMGYSVRTATHRYVEWRRITTGEVDARELYAYEGDELFERTNLASDPNFGAIMRSLATLLPPSSAAGPASEEFR